MPREPPDGCRPRLSSPRPRFIASHHRRTMLLLRTRPNQGAGRASRPLRTATCWCVSRQAWGRQGRESHVFPAFGTARRTSGSQHLRPPHRCAATTQELVTPLIVQRRRSHTSPSTTRSSPSTMCCHRHSDDSHIRLPLMPRGDGRESQWHGEGRQRVARLQGSSSAGSSSSGGTSLGSLGFGVTRFRGWNGFGAVRPWRLVFGVTRFRVCTVSGQPAPG